MPTGVYKRTKPSWNNGLVGRQTWHNTSGLKKGNQKGVKFGEHTLEHKKKISEAIKKIVIEGKHNFWKGGVTKANDLIRSSTEYKTWRTSVYKRDNYTCQICNRRGCVLNADHIKPFAFFPELRFDLKNGRTLCKECHKKTDTYLNRWYLKDRVVRAKRRQVA